MAKRVKCFVKDVSVMDDDSVGILLDFDGLEDPDEAVKWIMSRVVLGKQVTIWDVLAVILFINSANRIKK